MIGKKVDLRDPMLAAFLAFLLPGLGHFYQRRTFKGILYCVCILGTFFGGMRIGHGQVVYFDWNPPDNRTYAYLCQFWVGAPAVPALLQSQFRSKESFVPNYVPKKLATTFSGKLDGTADKDGQVSGQIELYPQQPDTPHVWSAKFTGILVRDGQPSKIEGDIANGNLESQVAPSLERRLTGKFDGHVEGTNESITGRLDGFIPRSLWDAYQAPLHDTRANEFAGEESELDRAHKVLGSRFELGVVFTMIAGLLNILAIFDALEGPAYGDDEESDQEKPPATPPPTPV